MPGAQLSSEFRWGLDHGSSSDFTDTQTRGAALSRISTKAAVVSTQAVRHYGVQARSEFDPIFDRGRPTYVDSYDGKTKVDKVSITQKSHSFSRVTISTDNPQNR